MSFTFENFQYAPADEKCLLATHSSGLKVYLIEKKDFSANYAIFGTHYGSIDTEFAVNGGETISVPEGIAHFLEHKLFEGQDGEDAFTKYASTGASANAYTSFDRTCYLFKCSDKLYENLDILLNFVSSPYFTPENVQKEQGIIGQEIRMYDDSPGWCVFFNTLRALFAEHPVRIDIAGTVESIAEITDKTLYDCYNTFYHPSNMFLCVCGNFDTQKVLDMVESIIKSDEKQAIKRGVWDEPEALVETYVEKQMPVAMPLFVVGIKDNAVKYNHSAEHIIATELLLEIAAGKISPLYDRLLKEGLIGSSFGNEFFHGYGYSALLFDGESKDPERVKQLIVDEISEIAKNGVDNQLFEDARRKLYGHEIRIYNDVEDAVSSLVDCVVDGYPPFSRLEALKNATPESVTERAKSLDLKLTALSVVKPNE